MSVGWCCEVSGDRGSVSRRQLPRGGTLQPFLCFAESGILKRVMEIVLGMIGDQCDK
jgi:hypothetical protein